MAEIVPAAAEAAPSPFVLALCLACLAVAAGAALAVQLSSSSWYADLLTFFVPYMAVAVAISTLAALWALWAQGNRPFVLDLSGLTVMAALFFAALAVSQSRAERAADPGGFTVMTYNVQGFNRSREPVVAAIRAASPDILVLQEVDSGWKDAVASLGYPFRAQAGGGGQSVEVLSRFPLLSTRRIAPKAARGLRQAAGYRVVLAAPDGKGGSAELVVYAIHPPTPRTYGGWLARNGFLSQVADMAASEPAGARVIVAGDFNVSSWSGTFRQFLAKARLEEAGGWSGPGASRVFWRKSGFAFGSPVDHIVVGDGLEVGAYGALRPEGNTSDHDPVMLETRFRPEG